MAIPFAQSSFPEIYEGALVGPLFGPWAAVLLGEAGLAPGERVLDVACGTGIVARLARERVGAHGKVVGVDIAAPMIEKARSVAPGLDWRVGDAASLPLAEGEQFDAVLCQQGLQFFPDRAAAAREMHRALRAGGRLVASCWTPDEDFPVLLELRRIAERHVGPIADKRHGFGAPGAIEALLRDAGFRGVRTNIVTRTVRFDDGAVFVRLNALALLGMSAGTRGADERDRLLDAIGRDSAGVVRANTDARGFAYEIASVLATATT